MVSLAGHWNLRINGSDIIPPLVAPEALPFCALISGRSADDYMIIRQAISNLGEEVIFEYAAPSGVSKCRRFSINNINMESVSNPAGVTISIILYVNKLFQEFSILRLGPRKGQRSIERYRLDANGSELKVDAEVAAAGGTIVRVVKYFDRHASTAAPRLIELSSISAWRNQDYRDLSILETTSVGIVQHISLGDTAAKRKAMETKNEIAQILGKFSGDTSTVIYILMVFSQGCKWLVGHRYSSFENLRRYVEAELAGDGSSESDNLLLEAPIFPAKTFGYLSSARLEDRKEKLENYISYFIDSKAMGSINVADALFSFLEIPEHLLAFRQSQEAARLREAEEQERQRREIEARKPKKRASIFQGTPAFLANSSSTTEPADNNFASALFASRESSAPVPTASNSTSNTAPPPPRAKRASIVAMIGSAIGSKSDRERSEFGVTDNAPPPNPVPSAPPAFESEFAMLTSDLKLSARSQESNGNTNDSLDIVSQKPFPSSVGAVESAGIASTGTKSKTVSIMEPEPSSRPPKSPEKTMETAATSMNSPLSTSNYSNSPGIAQERQRAKSVGAGVVVPTGSSVERTIDFNRVEGLPSAVTGTMPPAARSKSLSFSAAETGRKPAIDDDDNSSQSTAYERQPIPTASPSPSVSAASSASKRQSIAQFLTPNFGKLGLSGGRQRSASGVSDAVSVNNDRKYDINEVNSYNLPQDALFAVLRLGIVVLKHGRAGKPKRRLLRCDHSVSRLYWEKPNDKGFLGGLARKSDLEYTPDLPAEDKSVSLYDVIAVRKGTDEEEGGQRLIGTANLRRSCKRDELALCFYLVLPTRTFDIQCLNQDDYHVLYTNLDKLVRRLRSEAA